MIRRFACLLFLLTTVYLASFAGEWAPLGPDGGDARSLAFDPRNPDHVYMGTMAGKLFYSSDGGAHWMRYARLGSDDYVLDSIAIDPLDSNIMYVGAWSVNTDSGDLYRTTDGGRTWSALPGQHAKSVRALAIAASNPKILVTVALDGVYRTLDGGDSWSLISPPGHAEIKNLQSVAIDPKDPDVIYVGTWHLPWKTADGGKTWQSIKKGIIDDSDVFSIIIDPRNTSVVYLSACSGIYKSEDAGALFHKVQGMPFSARRTRVLAMDPDNSPVVYAGTTEGLWKTTDAGKTFHRMSAANVVVNGIFIDPRHHQKVMLATDRSGILLSDNDADSFSPSNHGFSHRQVTSLLMDRENSSVLYAGMINDKEFGGVFVSRDNGAHWQQMSSGLEGRDVFSLRQTAKGTLIAGTNRGVFQWKSASYHWEPINSVVAQSEPQPLRRGKGHKVVRAERRSNQSELETRVNDIAVDDTAGEWFAATPHGLFITENQGESWHGGPVAGQSDFIAVRAHDQFIAAATHTGVAISRDGGVHWYAANIPAYVTAVYDLSIGRESVLWIASREGAFRSADGDNWEHVLNGMPATKVNSIMADSDGNRLLASSVAATTLYESTDGGHHWHPTGDSGWQIRNVTASRGKLFITTAYDGILTQTEPSATQASVNAGASAAANR